jgi:hypothetical protein
MKQETLEKAAKNAYKKHSVKDDVLSLDEQIQRSGGFIVGFKEGANWQAEQLYKDDVIQTLEKGIALLLKKQEKMYSDAIEFGKWLDDNAQQREYYPMSAMTMEELFEQFKKK